MKAPIVLAVLSAALLLGACRSERPHGLPGEHRRAAFHPPRESLVKYDANKDGILTQAELTAGLRADYAAADTNHDGIIDLAEMRAVNEARWTNDASAATPLIDWNNDGHIDFQEFAAAPRSLFTQLDSDGDGVLSKDELNPASRADHDHSQDQGGRPHRRP